MVRIVLDTGAFFHPSALESLLRREEDVIIPAVTMAERIRQLRRDGRDEDAFYALLAEGDFSAEALTPEAAVSVATRVTDDAKWKRLARDAFIAAHVRPGDELWTTNPRDFIELGVPASQVVAVPSPS